MAETPRLKDTRKVSRDNTVKYNWRILQRLPDQERASYTSPRVGVLERPDGQLIVRYEGRPADTQEPPTRTGALWAGLTAWSPGPELRRVASSVRDHHISGSRQRHLTTLQPVCPPKADAKPVGGGEAVAKDADNKATDQWEPGSRQPAWIGGRRSRRAS